MHLLEKAVTLRFIARALAKFLHIESDKECVHVIIESVKKLSYKQDVWCLTVPDAREFSLANGAVVHNCDSFGMMAIVAEDIFDEQNRRAPPKVNFSGGGWMG